MPLTRRNVLTAMAAAPVLAPALTQAGTAEAAVPPAVLPTAEPAVWPAAVTLPAGHRFDLKSLPTDLLGKEILLEHTRVHQQVAFDPVTGLAYAVQLMSGNRRLPDEGPSTPLLSTEDRNRRGDLCVNQLAPDGTVLAVMHLRGFGHGGGLGVEHVDGTPWLWLETDADPVSEPKKFAYGKHIGRIAFTPGAVVDATDGVAEVFDPVPGAAMITPSLDVDHGRIAVRHETSGVAEYRVYRLDDFKNRVFTPERSFPEQYATQSWCLYGNLLYQNEGNAYSTTNPSPGNSWWTVYDVLTGAVVERTFNGTALDLTHRETEAITVRRTPTGPQLVFGFATQETRHMALYGISATTVPWTDLAYDPAYTATTGYRPQYRQSGDRVDLRLRVSPSDEKVPWASGATILTLPPHLRPTRTQGMVGTGTGAAPTAGPFTVRCEVTPDGRLRVYDERGLTGWIALDAGYFTS